MLKKVVVIFAVAIVSAAGAGVAVHDWWTHNRMAWYCLPMGFWGDYGPGWEFWADYYQERRGPDYDNEWILMRHWDPYPGACASADEDKHWRVVVKIAEERDWANANFMLAMKLGYGNFYGQTPYDPNIKVASRACGLYFGLREGFGDGEDLDLPRSFALLQWAAEQRNLGAQTLLANALKSGEWGKNGAWKVEIDLQASEEWMRKEVAESVARGDESAPRRAVECAQMRSAADSVFNQHTGENS